MTRHPGQTFHLGQPRPRAMPALNPALPVLPVLPMFPLALPCALIAVLIGTSLPASAYPGAGVPPAPLAEPASTTLTAAAWLPTAGAPARLAAPHAARPAPLPAPLKAPLPEVQASTSEVMAAAAPVVGASLPLQAPAEAVTPAAPAAPAAAAPLADRPATDTLLAAAAPRPPAAPAAPEPRFDLAINNAPAAQVFLQLANGTPYNMLVSPDVSGTLSITLKDTTVPEAMDTMREMFGFEYRITGNRIFVYPNTVQTRLYRINYLPGRRQGASDIRVTSSAISMSGSGGAAGTPGAPTSGSTPGGGTGGAQTPRPDDNAHVRTTSDADFWREVQASLVAMVGGQGGRSVVLNPAAGVVVVKATPAELRQVENYLKAVQLSIERQVMLEAKIVEVRLGKESQTGINWAAFGSLGKGRLSVGSAAPGTVLRSNGSLSVADGTAISPGADLAAGALGKGFYGLAFQAANFAALLNFLETQGEVQVLSSPRIATLNNQKAVLKVGSDELYVTGVSTTNSSNGNNTTSSPSLTLQPFFSGISLDVTPQIDESGTVMLHIHPTISTVTEKQKNIDLGALGAYRLPLAASTVNETDSIVRVRDGQIVAIGGLMKHEQTSERTGTPLLQDVPWLGGAFRQTTTVSSKRELVIMIKPTVIQDDGPWPDAPTFGAPQGRAPAYGIPGTASTELRPTAAPAVPPAVPPAMSPNASPNASPIASPNAPPAAPGHRSSSAGTPLASR